MKSTDPHAGLADTVGHLSYTAVPYGTRVGTPVPLLDHDLYIECIEASLQSVMGSVSAAAEEAYEKKNPLKGQL